MIGCNRVSFSAQSPVSLASELPPVVQGANAEALGIVPVSPIKNVTDSKNKVSVEFPFQFQILNFPYLYTLSKISMQLQAGGSCQVVHKMELSEEGLCESDPALADFCSTSIVKTLSSQDFTCQRLARAEALEKEQDSCLVQREELTQTDRSELADPQIYAAGSSEAESSQADPESETQLSGDVEEMPDDIDVVSTLSGLSHIGLSSDCQCFYENASDSGFKARWPALESHCKSYFSEYQNSQP